MSGNSMLKAILTVAVLAPAFLGAQAQAQQIDVNASGACKSALPAFDGNIRSRPTAVRNEGTANAFVSCSLPATHEDSLDLAAVFIANSNATAIDVTCTMVNGRNAMFFAPEFQTVTQNYAAGSGGFIVFDVSGADPVGGDLLNFSCNLPPGTEINMVTKVLPPPV